MSYLLYALVTAALVGADQLVKYLVKTHIALGESVAFLPGILGLTHFNNTGAAFSMFLGARWFFVVLTAAFIVLVAVVLWKKRITHPVGVWSLIVVLAGAIGNLIDRVAYGYVVDMFEVQFMHFAIFNVADIFIVCGGILLCIYVAFFYDKYEKGSKKS